MSYAKCRICLNSEGNEKFASAYDNGGEIADKILFFFGVSVFEDANKNPSLVCKKCVTTINTMFDLRKKCSDAEEVYFKKLRKIQSSVLCAAGFVQSNDEGIVDKKLEGIVEEKAQTIPIKKRKDSLFYSSSKLKRLRKRANADESLNQCGVCYQVFKSHKILQQHELLHSDELNYVCRCGAKFKQNAGLQKHKRYAHNIQ